MEESADAASNQEAEGGGKKEDSNQNCFKEAEKQEAERLTRGGGLRREHHDGSHTRSASVRQPRLDREKSRGSSTSLVLVGSRRGSLVVSPTGDLGKKHLKHHVQFHTANGNAPKPQPPSSPSSSASSSSLGCSEMRAPDGGWGWVVVAAAFMVNMIADGITFSFGVLFTEFLEYFGESKSKTAWIGSLFMAMPLLSGPVASFLTDRYGCRKCCVVGGFLSAFGFAISSLTNSIELLFLTFGVIAGMGLSLCYVAAVVIVAYYFEARRSFATGLSVCGSGIGTFIFAPISQFLLNEYGWRGATLILAGFFLNLCVCGMLMRDLEWTKAKRKKFKGRRNNQASNVDTYSTQSVTVQTPASCPSAEELKRLLQKPGETLPETITVSPVDQDNSRLFSSLVNLPTFVRNGEKVPIEVLEIMTANRNLYQVLLQNYPNLLISRSFSDSAKIHEQIISINSKKEGLSARFLSASPEYTECPNGVTNTTTNSTAIGGWPLPNSHRSNHHHHHKSHQERRIPTAAYLKDLRVHRHSLTYRGAMLNINRYKLRASSCPDIYRNSMATIPKEKVEWFSGLEDLWLLLKEMLDFSYFTNIRFLLFAISNFLLYTWYDVPYVYIKDYSTEMGHSETEGSILISIIGILNMVGEVALGWLGDLDWVNPSFVYAISMGFCGAVVASVPFMTDYYKICVSSGAFGLFIAANYALTSIILVEQITIERFTNAYGLLLLVQGVANLVGPPLAGGLYDITEKYDLPFYLGGLFIALSGLLLVIPPIVDLCKSTPASKNQNKEKLSNNV